MENDIEKIKVLIEHHEEILADLRHQLSVAEESKQKVAEFLKPFDDICNSFITKRAIIPCDL